MSHLAPTDSRPIQPITIEQLARYSGETPERLETWIRAGVIGFEGGLRTEDIGRARLVHELLHYGHSLEDIAAAFHQPHSVFAHFLEMMADRLSRPMYTVDEAAALVGLEPEVVRTVAEGTGITDATEMLDDEDITALRSIKVAIDAGYPLDALMQILRVYADATRRAAEVGQRTSHFYLHQHSSGEQPPEEVFERLDRTFATIEPLVEPALLYFFRKGSMNAAWEDMLMHLEEQAGLEAPPEIPGQIRRAIMFVDLASFTPLAEAMGDLRAAQVLERFAVLVRRAVQRCHGRIVKQIGDGFMIVFPECFSAVSCGLELEQRASNEPQFPAIRIGLHYGPLLYREGDYVGSNVNIAARLADEAQRHQFLVTAEVRARAKHYEGVEWVRIGKRRLKGLTTEVEIFAARAAEPGETERVRDPVCGMEMGALEVTARLSLDGRDYSFCSDECLRRFVKSPKSYAG